MVLLNYLVQKASDQQAVILNLGLQYSNVLSKDP